MKADPHKGFTLLEVVIYIGLFAIVMGGAITATVQLLKSGERNERSAAIQEEGTFLIRKINWLVTSSSVVSAHGGDSLTITKRNGPDFNSATDNPLVLTGQDGAVTVTRGSLPSVTLNSDALPVTDFVATVDSSSGKTVVDVHFAIQTIPFVFTTYLR